MAAPIQFSVSELDHHASRVFVGVTVALLTISLATLTSRIVFKMRSKLYFTLDDYLIAAGFVRSFGVRLSPFANIHKVFAVVTWALFLAVIAVCVPSSRSFLTLNEFQQIIKLGALGNAPWICSIACIKISMACLLLRFQQNAIWRMFLYGLMVLITATSAGYFLFDLLQCIPLAATWDPTIQGAKCVSTNTIRIVSNTISGINIATDIVLSLFPLTFLRKLRRPLMEKVLVGVLMAMGMAAAAASITKALLLRTCKFIEPVTFIPTFFARQCASSYVLPTYPGVFYHAPPLLLNYLERGKC